MRPKKFKVILNGHLDIIPGKEHQYTPIVKGNKLYGVGSMDMKSNVVCLMMAFKEAADKVDYPLALQIVTDEEIGGFKGTKFQVDEGVRADFVISGETTNFNIVNEAKGILWLKIAAKGKTAHGAYPWRGENAIWKMTQFLKQLEKKFAVPDYEAKTETTVNVARIETTNEHFNKIPDNCTVSLDIRYAPKDRKTILKRIKTMIPKGFKLEILANEPALFVEKDNKYLQLLKQIDEKITKRKVEFYMAQGSSDARHFTRVGNNGIEFGPIGGGIGTDNEWVDIKSLEKYTLLLKEFLLSINT